MKFLVMVKATADSESGKLPDPALVAAMGKYNEELVKAGVMLAAEGLHPSSKGARISFAGGQRTIVDGPFAETKELIAGFWIFQVKSKDEALEWLRRCPAPFGDKGGEIELRQIFSPDDFAPIDPTGDLRKHNAELQKKLDERR